MKHIKSIKLFESNLFDTISDICLELQDEGFDIKFDEVEGREHISELIIKMYNHNHEHVGFKPITIGETIKRIHTVLGVNYINLRAKLYKYDSDYYEVHINNMIIRKDIIYGIQIRFYK